MSNWAIVVGVDRYWTPAACLQGAVRDALAMREWLLDPAGGGVPPAQLRLLLAPTDAGPNEMAWLRATRDELIGAIEEVLNLSGGTGRRFYFHFSGHGLAARLDFSSQAGIVPTDFREHLPDKVLTVLSLFELFRGTTFDEQFFFIDACRNLPFHTEKRLGSYPNPRQPQDPAKPQFVMYATQPGVLANEIGAPGNEQGAFTQALLQGLRGLGTAKRWDGGAGTYVVRWDSLFDFVHRDLTARRLAATAARDPALIQQPRQYGERGIENPLLGQIAPAAVADATLRVDIDPRAIADRTEIIVRDLVADNRKPPPLVDLPTEFRLRPRTYSVRALAPGYQSKREALEITLYGNESVTVELEPLPPALTPPGPVTATTRGLEVTGRAATSGSFAVGSNDMLAYVQVTDDAGAVVATGRGRVHASNRTPGFYRARLLLPEGPGPERSFELAPGAHVAFDLTVPFDPSPVLQDIIVGGHFPIEKDKTIHLSEAIGPSASVRLSTMLALSAAAGVESDSPYGMKLKSLGIAKAAEQVATAGTPSGCLVVFGDEKFPPFWHDAVCTWWPLEAQHQQSSDAPTPDPEFPSIGTFAWASGPGTHWVSIEQGAANITLPVALLPGRISVVVLTRDLQGRSDLQQYSCAMAGAHLTTDARFRDPQFTGARFPQIRRIELMQRYVATGQVMPTAEDVRELLYDKWADPIAGCLGCYLLLRTGRIAELDVPVNNLIRYFGELPDAHVLMGKLLESRGQDPSPGYWQALITGVPMFRDGLALLAEGAKRFGRTGDRSEYIQRLLTAVPVGSLWSSMAEGRARALTSDPTPAAAAAVA